MSIVDRFAPTPPAHADFQQSVLASLCRKVLRYSYRRDAPKLDELPPDHTLEELLEAQLSDLFFSSVWADRREADWLIANLLTHRALLLHGVRGSGKSTIFYRLLRIQESPKEYDLPPGELAAFSGHDLLLFDVEPIVINDDSDKQETLRDLYATFLKQLERRYLREAEAQVEVDGEEVSVTDAWLHYRLWNCDAFGAAADFISNMSLGDSSVKAQVEYLRSVDNKELLVDAMKDFKNQTAVDRFDDLVSFLVSAQYLRRRICVMIDNVDWKSPATQDLVYDEYERLYNDFPSAVTVVLNARDNTLTRYREIHGGNIVGETCAVGADGALVEDVVSRRLTALSSLLRALRRFGDSPDGPGTAIYGDTALQEAGEVLAENDTIRDVIGHDYITGISDAVRVGCGKLVAGEQGQSFSDMLLKWHNYSIRSAGYHLGAIMDDICVGVDPAGIRGRPMSAGELDARSDNFNLLYRHMIFGGAKVTSPPPVLDLVMPVFRSNHRPVFLPLHVLEYLARARHDPVSWGELVELGSVYGNMSADTMWDAVRELNCQRGYEAEGFVRVHSSRGGPGMRDDVVVEARPAAFMFLGLVSSSLEYLCWCGARDPEVQASSLLDGIESLAEFASNETRIRAALSFVALKLLPGFERESERFRILRPDAEAKSLRGAVSRNVDRWYGGFGPFTWGEERSGLHFASRAVVTLEQKVSSRWADGEIPPDIAAVMQESAARNSKVLSEILD